jgi:hypothetical protein
MKKVDIVGRVPTQSDSSWKHHRPRVRKGCQAASLIGILVLLPMPRATSAYADPTSGTFSLAAEADGLNVEVGFPGELPLVQTVAASPWGASAVLDSLGGSSAAAGTPYSPFLYSLPGTINGLGSGQTPPLPQAPGEVSTSYPTTPTASEAVGPYNLSAKSGPDHSSGAVADGANPPGSSNTTVFANADAIANSDNTVEASATAGVDLFDLGGVLDIGKVASFETIKESRSQRPIVTGSTDLGVATLLGSGTGVSNNNVVIPGGSSVPIPLSTAVMPTLNAALQPAGISLTYIPQSFKYTDGSSSTGGSPIPTKTLQSVDSGALQVAVTRSIPGQATLTITYTLGRVFVSATSTAGLAASNPITPTGGGGLTSGAPATTAPGAGSSALGTSTVVSGNQPSTNIPTTSGAGPAQANPAPGIQPVPQLGATTPVLRRGSAESEMEIFYIILAVGGLAALASSLLVRHLGVRLAFFR